jgi:hypothetical protein
VKIQLGSQVLAWRRVWIPDFAMVTRFKHILAGSIGADLKAIRAEVKRAQDDLDALRGGFF